MTRRRIDDAGCSRSPRRLRGVFTGTMPLRRTRPAGAAGSGLGIAGSGSPDPPSDGWTWLKPSIRLGRSLSSARLTSDRADGWAPDVRQTRCHWLDVAAAGAHGGSSGAGPDHGQRRATRQAPHQAAATRPSPAWPGPGTSRRRRKSGSGSIGSRSGQLARRGGRRRLVRRGDRRRSGRDAQGNPALRTWCWMQQDGAWEAGTPGPRPPCTRPRTARKRRTGPTPCSPDAVPAGGRRWRRPPAACRTTRWPCAGMTALDLPGRHRRTPTTCPAPIRYWCAQGGKRCRRGRGTLCDHPGVEGERQRTARRPARWACSSDWTLHGTS